MTKACYDIDFILFAAASVAEETLITATHVPSGKVMEFDNRTALWGHHSKKIGGWIGLQNEISSDDYYKAADFTVEDGQKLRPFRVKGMDGEPDTLLAPLDGAKKYVTDKIKAINRHLLVEEYFGYTGRGEVFRHDVATLLPYKGNRSAPSPLVLAELKQWAVDTHNIQWVEDAYPTIAVEADDACNMATVAGYKAWKAGGMRDENITYQVAIDKDTKGNEGWHFNPDKDEAPRLIEGFGKLWLTEKGDVDGAGRMFFYWQIAHGDTTDNYVANCFSSVKYAGKGAYNDLVDCKNDKEAWTKLVAIFKKLYPAKVVVDGCKGLVEIDHMYVLQEMATMAMMLRHVDDKIDVRAVCKKLGVDIGN